VTSVERLAIERGMQQGIVKGEGAVLRRVLARRFSPLPQPVLERLDRADSHQLETWADRVIDAKNLDEILADD